MIRASKNSAKKSSTEDTNQRIPGSSPDLLISPQQLDFFLPLACEWAEVQEQPILRDSQPLTETQLVAARLVLTIGYPNAPLAVAVRGCVWRPAPE
jgi:hypothetical protein